MNRNPLRLFILCSINLLAIVNILPCCAQSDKITNLKVTILSTMLADQGIGEWGFCALIEVDGRKILFDTGARPETVFNNANELGIDLADVKEVFISHSHRDHTGGLLTLRSRLSAKNPSALSVAHVGEGMFYTRENSDYNAFIKTLKSEYEKSGGKFVSYKEAVQLYPGVWITGPVPRKHDERNWSGSGRLTTPEGKVVDDNLPEDQSLVFNTSDGLIIISGCGHSGVINTIDYARQVVHPDRVVALIGGFHLFNLNDEKMKWTTDKLKGFGVQNFIGAHCTGINAVYTLQRELSLDRQHAVVGAVGAQFELGKGIYAGQIAK